MTEAKNNGADFILFPECFITSYFMAIKPVFDLHFLIMYNSVALYSKSSVNLNSLSFIAESCYVHNEFIQTITYCARFF